MNLTLEEVAERLSVTYQQVQRYERGKSTINVEILQQIARVLAVPITYFLGEVKQARQVRVKKFRDEEELVDRFRRIRHKKTRAMVLSIALLASQGGPGEQLTLKGP